MEVVKHDTINEGLHCIGIEAHNYTDAAGKHLYPVTANIRKHEWLLTGTVLNCDGKKGVVEVDLICRHCKKEVQFKKDLGDCLESLRSDLLSMQSCIVQTDYFIDWERV